LTILVPDESHWFTGGLPKAPGLTLKGDSLFFSLFFSSSFSSLFWVVVFVVCFCLLVSVPFPEGGEAWDAMNTWTVDPDFMFNEGPKVRDFWIQESAG